MIYTGIGSRAVPFNIQSLMRKIALIMAINGTRLRSGGALGSDSAFEAGCDYADGESEIYLPWVGFNKHKPDQGIVIGKDTDVYRRARILAEKYHPAWYRLSDAAKEFMTRNSFQILGGDMITATDLVVCWTERGKLIGGTAQALKIAKDLNIPIFNMGCYSEGTILENFYTFIKGIKIEDKALKENILKDILEEIERQN